MGRIDHYKECVVENTCLFFRAGIQRIRLDTGTSKLLVFLDGVPQSYPIVHALIFYPENTFFCRIMHNYSIFVSKFEQGMYAVVHSNA